MRVWPGSHYPLGATYDGNGTNFSVFSEIADKVELCLFDTAGNERRFDLKEQTGYCWHGYLPGVSPGQLYGFRVHGPWRPVDGHRCNPAKLLLDPYAKAIEGQLKWDPAVFPYRGRSPNGKPDDQDNAAFVPKSVVHNSFFDWRNDRPPNTPLYRSVIYELHVKGFTQQHRQIPPELRGTFAGLAHPAAIDYLVDLGITAVELMPVHQFVDEKRLADLGLRNYWGYNTIGYFAPHNQYCARCHLGEQVQEFKEMVRRLHEARIEVILDVVYNHTAEGDESGPMLSFRGFDNAAYYRLHPQDKRRYRDYTGTGNSMNMRHPNVLQMTMDSLRYWITEMHVDGFRFDLASTLARELHEVDRLGSFLDIIHQDPVIGNVKLIAEPWDIGEGGYQVGKFPPKWSEWNGQYRDFFRDYWAGRDSNAWVLVKRFTGSPDLYEETGRRPHASINYITCHDGFTLHDLVTYERKRNIENGENNRDGTDDNRSWNCGHEGETDDPEIIALRRRQMRNFIVTLLLSQGIPMIQAGDEMGRTQGGNNNAYCHDSPLSWIDWGNIDQPLHDFVRQVIRLRLKHPVFRRWRWLEGGLLEGNSREISWFLPDGNEIEERLWGTNLAGWSMLLLSGQIHQMNHRGEMIRDDDFLLLFNSHHRSAMFTLPDLGPPDQWEVMIDTVTQSQPPGVVRRAREPVQVAERSLQVLRRITEQ